MPCGTFGPKHAFMHRHRHHYGGRHFHGGCHGRMGGGGVGVGGGGGRHHHRHHHRHHPHNHHPRGPPPFFHPYFFRHMMMSMMGEDGPFTPEPVHDVTEDEHSFAATVDLPGYKPNDITVSVERYGRIVRVVAKNDNGNGKVEKVFKIHGMIDTLVTDTNIPTAILSHGVLSIRANKDHSFGEVRQIQVSELVVEESTTTAAASIAPSAPLAHSMAQSSSSSEREEGDWIDVDEAEEMLSSPVESGAATDVQTTAMDIKTEKAHKEEKKVDFVETPVATPAAATAEPVDSNHQEHDTVSIDLPGVRLQDLRVQLEQGGNLLRISGIRRWGASPGNQSFEREILLGSRRRGSLGFDIHQVHANLSYGVLTVTFPPRGQSASSSTMIVPVVEEAQAGTDDEVEMTVSSAMAAMDMKEQPK